MFECGQHSYRVQIIVVTNVRDTEKLSFHLRLSVGHDRAKLVAEAFANGRLVDKVPLEAHIIISRVLYEYEKRIIM